MSETKFTPGPWFAHDDHPQHACYHIAPADYWHDELATIYSPGDPEADANASLIAAAPELYEALEVFGRLADQLDGDDEVERTPDDEWAKFRLLASDYRKARAALAKARGEQ
ncbi:hypothetical protein NFI08_16465 [Halomonas sp. EF61]|uniref:hypothetical protein n=1 Tax=Halomonas sp. EF61 TaxID=2950869 RepID=UPI0032DF518E